MNCPLVLYPAGTLGTVQYYSPCECTKLCQYTKCKYLRCGFLVQFSAVGATSTDTVSLLGKKCGGSMPLVAESTNALVTNATITAGQVYRVIPSIIDGVLRGIVQGV